MYNFTVIIPHKNTPDLLQRCLNSIPQRDDLQIIIVDDNSNSSIVDFQNFPGIGRSNTEVIFTKEGKGAGYARNQGLKTATGKWILFADADDYFEENAFNTLDLFSNSKAQLVLFNSICRQSDDKNCIGKRQHICSFFSKNIKIYKNGEISCKKLLLDHGVPWGKMVRKTFLVDNNILFEEITYANDVMWSTLIALSIKNSDLQISDNILYCLTDRNGSLYWDQDENNVLCRYSVFQNQRSLLKKRKEESLINSPIHDLLRRAHYLGLFPYLRFLKKIVKNEESIPYFYQFEKKMHFRYPYIYISILFITSILYSIRRTTRI